MRARRNWATDSGHHPSAALACIALAISIVTTFGISSAATATQLEITGEAGLASGPDTLDCPGGYAAGLTARTGAWFDALGVLCAKFDPATGHLVPAGHTSQTGEDGGAYRDKACPVDQVIEYIQFSMFEILDFDDLGATPDYPDKTTLLDDIIFRCRPVTAPAPDYAHDPNFLMTSDDAVVISGPHSRTPSIVGDDVNYGFSHNEICPDGEVAVGFRVLARLHADKSGVVQLGMDCDAVPKLAPPPPAATPTPLPPVATDYSKGQSTGIGLPTAYAAKESDCKSGDTVMGLSVMVDPAGRISAITPNCANPSSTTSYWGDAMGSGGGGPGPFTAQCSFPLPVVALTAVSDKTDHRVRALGLKCGPNGKPGDRSVGVPGAGDQVGTGCPPGKAAVGVYGWLTDAPSNRLSGFGMVCASVASASTTSTAGSGSASGAGSTGPATAPASTFLGAWTVTVGGAGTPPYSMEFHLSGASIRGSYQLANGPGTIDNGVITGNDLHFTWSQDGFKGSGDFSPDSAGLTGTWKFDAGLHGNWTAHR